MDLPKLHRLDLPLFASHCRVLAREPAESTGSLTCLPGLTVHFRITKREDTSTDPIWDSVFLGKNTPECNDHCGNRSGGVRAYATMVETHLNNLNAEILRNWHNESH